jgi:alpha-amylase/alpha-mannosidase (GH57 family)
MKRLRYLNLYVLFTLLLAACVTPTPTAAPPTPTSLPAATPTSGPVAPTPTSAPAEEPLYLAIVWHQHQPLYYKDADGIYTRPWVRVHATKDYYDMAATVQKYPNVHVTFNLTPVLLRQLDDFAEDGAKDKYWVLAEQPAAELTEADKDFILRRFFDANWDHVIARFPRYEELLKKRGGTEDAAIAAALASFTEQDFRDLQVWFNLAWFDPDFLAEEPLKSLVEKGQGFSEDDKEVLFTEAVRTIQGIVPLHKQMQDAGQIEVITTPYAHPILPLIYDTNLALVGNPGAEMPDRFSYPNDAIAHLQKSVEIYQAHFGQAPRGMWPGEGSVAQEIVPLVSKAGYQWMASGEPVLAASLGIGSFTRDAHDTVQEADQLYRPYFVQGKQGEPVMIVFRDWTLSDKIGFTYSQTPGDEAAADFVQRLENVRAELKKEGATGPHLVSVILDGENAWENYDNDGKVFLNSLYQKLSESQTIKTVTPSEYLKMFPDQQKLDKLFPGAWFSANYDTWIGEPEEKTAWNYLGQVRFDLSKYDITKQRTPPSPEALQQALDFMYLAEGSDWFWWYGGDQDSGNDAYFDEGFRALLAGVYTSLSEPVPAFVNVPIIPERPETPSTQFGGLFSPKIDGEVSPADEWARAGTYLAAGGAMARAEDVAAALYYGMDSKTLYLRVDAKSDWASLGDATVGFYMASPRLDKVLPNTRLSQGSDQPYLLGIGATNLFEVKLDKGQPAATIYAPSADGWVAGEAITTVVANDSVLELAVPLTALGELEAGDDLRLAAVASQGERDLQSLPVTGPAQVVVPDLGLTTIALEVADPEGDDNGPGAYTYPTDGVFEKQVYDLKTFSVGYDDKNMVFKFVFYGPVPNPWGSPNNLAVQTLDVYVDKDPGAGTGARLLLPGRNAALTVGDGWEFAVWAEGWTPQFVAPDASGAPKQVLGVDFKVIVDPASSTVTLRVPRSAFGEGDPTAWGYVGMVMSQEGFPSPGVWRVRDGQETAAQWKFGGVPKGATNYPRIFDLADMGDQAQQLAFTPSSADVGTLTPDDFAQVNLLIAK